jgi:transcriptional regulator with XRE-family HTH domain
MNKIISRIIEYRKAKGLTQKQMADKLGIGQVGYSQIETGKTDLTLDRLIRIANVLEVNMITLLYPDFKDVKFFQELQDENFRLKKNNDLLINACEDKDRLLGLILKFYPETARILEANKTLEDIRGLGITKTDYSS